MNGLSLPPLPLSRDVRISAALPPTHSIFAKITPTAKVVVIAAAALGGVAFAWTMPASCFLSLAAVAVVSPFAIVEMMETCSLETFKKALVVTFIAFGALSIGVGGSIAAYGVELLFSSMFLLSSEVVLSAECALFGLFAFSSMTGFVLPFAVDVIENGMEMLKNPRWAAALAELKESFLRESQRSNDWLKMIFRKFDLFACLSYPQMFLGSVYNDQLIFRNFAENALRGPRHFSLMDLEKEVDSLKLIVNYHRQYGDRTSGASSWIALKDKFQTLNQGDLLKGCEMLMEARAMLVPSASPHHADFFEIFNFAEAKTVIKASLEEGARKWKSLSDDYLALEKLKQELGALEREFDANKEGDVSERLQTISDRANAYKQKFLAMHTQKKHWASAQGDQQVIQEIRQLIPFSNNFQRIAGVYNRDFERCLKATGLQLQEGGAENIFTTLERLRSKVNAAQKPDEEEEVSAWEYLGSNCGFVVRDYDELQASLGLSSSAEIPERLEQIGLGSFKDLVDKNIVRHAKSKEMIKRDLKNFIKESLRDKRDLRSRIYSLLSAVQHPNLSFNSLQTKVSQVVYRAMVAGLILVPVLMYPKTTAVGFVGGGIYYVLRHFNLISPMNLPAYSSSSHINIIRGMSSLVLRRNFFSLSPASQRNQQLFVQGSLIAKMRVVAFEALITIGIAYGGLGLVEGGLLGGFGAFIQGAALPREFI